MRHLIHREVDPANDPIGARQSSPVSLTMPDPLQPLSSTASYFELLGVSVAADDAALTRRFHILSRLYHPDRWATADAETQTTALDSSALVNDAYRTLKDPFTRAEYLLRRERSTRPDDTKDSAAKPPQELFAQVLELQEALMEYQEARLDEEKATMARLRPTLEEAKGEFEAAYAGLADKLRALFARWDAGDDRETLLDELAGISGTRGYLRRVLTNLNGTLG
ncbi:MAG: Fe-S protein assembly co-chaperone HscB [Cytophagales bacterium]|nr:Fe-S protein assembly co-chaperone HscB [Armatimonadota bacterium]